MCSGKPAVFKSPPVVCQLHVGFDFSEGTSAKCIFDVEIKKLRAEIFLHVEKTKIVLDVHQKPLKERLRPTFCNFIFAFPEVTFHVSLLAPHQYIHISTK